MGRKSRERAAALSIRRKLASEGVSIREARPGEGRLVYDLVRLVDPDHPESFHNVINTIDTGVDSTHSAGLYLNLVIENKDGKLLGALSAVSPFDWLQDPDIDWLTKNALARSVATVEALAIAPQARGMRLGCLLLKHAEEHLRASGCRLLIADFILSRPHLAQYYTKAGFTVLPEGQFLYVGLPKGTIFQRPPHTDCRTSWKALSSAVTAQPGLLAQGQGQTPVPVPGGVIVGVLPL
ncbi:GNAT family N-acetyltransferase [Streptomyces sp. NPDC003697]